MRGYVYVLVNSSLPGLVKVGKTTRLPSERAGELSAVTGVPTPFIVAFERPFADCSEAEAFVHTRLERMGLREAKNREFLRATTPDVIKAVMEAPGAISHVSALEDALESTEYIAGDELGGLELGNDDAGAEPWASLLEEAYEHQYGLEGRIEDEDEALRLYKDAGRLGSAEATTQSV